MLLKFYYDHKSWLAGTPQIEDIERSESHALVRVDSWIRNGGYAVEQHRIETVTFKIWRANDVA